MTKHRVLLVDDHPVVRVGLKVAIEKVEGLEVCAEAGSARQARELVAKLRPDLAVVDLMLADEDGLTLVRELRELCPQLRVVVVSMLDEAIYAERARSAGAEAYFNKATGLAAFAPTIRRLMSSRRGEQPEESLDETPKRSGSGIGSLSNRELQVFQLIGLGRASRDIAAALGVSVKTVETHRENIKTKLGVTTSVQLVGQAALWVRDRGLVR